MTARDALRMSLNVPAVMVLDRVGPLRFHPDACRMPARIWPFPPVTQRPACRWRWAGLASALADITMLYAGIAEGGEAQAAALSSRMRRMRATHRLFGPVAAYYLRDVLDGVALPDGWAMGQGLLRAAHHRLQDRHLLRLSRRLGGGFLQRLHRRRSGSGRADGTPRAGQHRPRSGGADSAEDVRPAAARPAFRSPGRRPARSSCTSTAALPPALRVFARDRRAAAAGTRGRLPPPAIAFPPNGAVVPLPRQRTRRTRDPVEGRWRPRASDLAGQWRSCSAISTASRRRSTRPPAKALRGDGGRCRGTQRLLPGPLQGAALKAGAMVRRPAATPSPI